MPFDDDALRPSRRGVLAALSTAALLPAVSRFSPPALAQEAGALPEAGDFTFDNVIALARIHSGEAFEERRLALTPPFADLDYDEYRAIRVRPERRLWADAGLGFEVDLLPPGHFYVDRVDISLVVRGEVFELTFDPTLFHFHPDYFGDPEGDAPPDAPRDLSYSGFRIRAPINRPDVMDEVAVFQGARYFRAIGRDQIYGLSARGLAIATASPEGEEFPRFRHYFIHVPEKGATSMTIHALLDSPSVTGAYEFVVTPGAETTMDVRSVLIPRREITRAGIAPLTSMFFFGPGSRAGIDDYREAVHDSSGLQMVTGAGERLWRPLSNPPSVEVSAFADRDPRGFGLVQRRRSFADFEDAEARYERRPSAWVAPQGNWGTGAVVLVELPTENEFNDNIVAFWRPADPLAADRDHAFDYRIHWTAAPPDEVPLARVIATRTGATVNATERRTFVIDFDRVPEGTNGLTPKASATEGEIVGLALVPLPDGRLRALIDFDPGAATMSEMRLELVDAEGADASEVWLHRWSARR